MHMKAKDKSLHQSWHQILHSLTLFYVLWFESKSHISNNYESLEQSVTYQYNYNRVFPLQTVTFFKTITELVQKYTFNFPVELVTLNVQKETILNTQAFAQYKSIILCTLLISINRKLYLTDLFYIYTYILFQTRMHFEK